MAKAGALAAGVAGIGGLFFTLRQGIGEFTEATKAAAQTNAVIKSTGGAANVTARDVNKLANEILRYSGIDDEAVKSAENLLLTFTNVRNEVGKGNDVFNQATRVIADMSVALGKDLNSSTIMVGKALQDPVRGLTALGRAGVNVRGPLADTVKRLVEMGDTAGAQKAILAELTKEFGGSARAAGQTLPGQLNILKETFNNLAGDLVSRAIPAVTTFVTFLNDKGIPVLSEAFGKIGSVVGPAITGLVDAFKAAGPAILGVLEPLGEVFRTNVVPILQQFQEIGVKAITAVSAVIKENGPQLRQIFQNLGEVITNVAKIVVPLLRFAFTEVLPVAIKILIPILVVLTEVLAKVSTAIRVVANVIQAVLLPAFSLILSVGAAVATFLTKILTRAFEIAVPPIRAISGVIENVLGGAFRAATVAAGGVRDVFEWFANKAAAIWQRLSRIIPPAVAIITAPFQHLWDVLEGILGTVFRMEQAIGRVGDLLGQFGGLLGKIPGLAAGGPVSKGQAYIVGEKGPELFVPGSAGTIVPNVHAPNAATMAGTTTMGGGVTVIINGDVTGDEIVEKVRRGLYDIGRRNPGTGLALT